MCGRYELSSHPDVVALAFGLPQPPPLRPRYNIAPTQQVPIVRRNVSGTRELVEMRWGLVPRWAKDPSIGARMINARAESIATSGAFRDAYARHRCLVPVNGFYEWRRVHTGKQPLHIGMPDGRPFALAGLYERWRSAEGDVLDTCTIVTTQACASLRDVHDRMPVIVPDAEYARWLDCSNPDVGDLLRAWSGEALRLYPVSTRVNAVRNDDATLCDPVDAAADNGAAARPESPAPSKPAQDCADSTLAARPPGRDDEPLAGAPAPMQSTLF
jgi:putative SOS response-associated peptidase YedK